MAHQYVAVLWNRQKKLYDLYIFLGIILYLLAFIVLTMILKPNITEEALIIRASGSLSILILHIILIIGPLSRLNTRFLPLLYNRRHLGVTMFLIAFIHGGFSIIQFHALGNVNPLVSIFVSNNEYGDLLNFPFQTLGFFALIILFLMAATSHDFWLTNLGPRFWKAMHMMVYVAYALVILHVALGIAQSEPEPIMLTLLGIGLFTIVILHLMTAFKEVKNDREKSLNQRGYVLVGTVEEIPENKAVTINVNGEKVAIFKYDGKLSAVSNVCRHQNGPLGEGKIVDGCITCPWHGYQYLPHNGCSPPPFTEKVETFDIVLEDNKVYLNPKPYEPGTERSPVVISS
ncbi:ferric reductase-like transmembrane domain-containing protein [Fulvivirgaceae bacterium BMA10]|uniref:Ferric reductase-like transmembrane domain-containing protein n=1 Tax=Splendidivirga corallicola TaxID=3051826 RepID=A0ABT8KRL7_9BACT|nr:ferric reductase-like transmembrane domain-containing protein [Fulvivirgaceae bacterium BMA10]